MKSLMLEEAQKEIENLRLGLSAREGTSSQHYVELDAANDACHVYWGGYDYLVPLTDIASPLAALGWIEHLGEKSWPLMTPERIAAFIGIIANHYGWKTR